MPQQGVCVSSHTVQTRHGGPGVCCAALAASGQHAAEGVRVAAKNKKGKCFVCEVKVGKKGNLVFKHGKSLGLCPTASEGCCQLLAAS